MPRCCSTSRYSFVVGVAGQAGCPAAIKTGARPGQPIAAGATVPRRRSSRRGFSFAVGVGGGFCACLLDGRWTRPPILAGVKPH